jgi:hypothetical protein
VELAELASSNETKDTHLKEFRGYLGSRMMKKKMARGHPDGLIMNSENRHGKIKI